MKSALLLLFSFFIFTQNRAQILINEFSTDNDGQILDIHGEAHDWIELYNNNSATLDLAGYFLSDDPTAPLKWQIEKGSIQSKDHLVLFASQKDQRSLSSAILPFGKIHNESIGYSDETHNTNPGISTSTPFAFTEFVEEITPDSFHVSASINLIKDPDTTSTGYIYGGVYIDLGIEETQNLSAYNELAVTATITKGKQVAFHVFQEDEEPWNRFHFPVIGNGIENFTYRIPLYKGMQGLDLSLTKWVEIKAWDLGQTDITVTDVKFNRAEYIGAISTSNYFYADEDGSSVTTLNNDEVVMLTDSTQVISAVMDRTNGGYAGIGLHMGDWNTTVNMNEYDEFIVKGYLEKNKSVTIRLIEEEKKDVNWTSYGYKITGTGELNDEYRIPINVADFDRSQLFSIQIEAAVDGPVELEFNEFLFHRSPDNGSANFLHTNFKLSNSDTLVLSDPSGFLLQKIAVPKMEAGNSFGRETDGAPTTTYFSTPTPNETNSNGVSFNGYCEDKIMYSIAAGFYPTAQSLELSGSSEIRYTLNGEDPTATSNLYESPIAVDSSMVIKAACFTGGTLPEKLFTNTLFIGYDSDLPVWSISTHPGNLFDEDTGMYVLGPEGSYEEDSPHFGANFWEDWERPVHIEFFETDGQKVIDENCGLQIFGNYSRANPKKSIALFFRDEYGPKRLEYPLFPEAPWVNTFDDLILRSSGNDMWNLSFRDGFHAQLMKDADFEKQKYRASVVFINGEYWGIHNIREKSNADYFKENNNIDADNIDMLSHYVSSRNNTSTDDFENFLYNEVGNITYDEAKEYIDMSSFIDYHAFEIYISNADWPGNNIKYWRQRAPQTKWRYFMYDTDFSTALYPDTVTQHYSNAIHRAMNFTPGVWWPNSENSTKLLREFMKFSEFKDGFVNRYCDLMNTTLRKEKVLAEIDEIVDYLDPEMNVNHPRWGFSIDDWYENIDIYKNFWNLRAPFARKNMQNELQLSDEVNITLNVMPADAGTIKINSVIPDELPWNGYYFNGVPVVITAIPNPGFTFKEWSTADLGSPTGNPLTIDLPNDGSLTAVFNGSAAQELITISEINYNSSDLYASDDWVEIHNYSNFHVDISGWTFRDDKPYHGYTFPEQTQINADSFIVVAKSKLKFDAVYPGLYPVAGPLDFGFSNGGETLFLFDENGKERLQFTYDDENGWDELADGQGYTLELVDIASDINLPESWIAACEGGSPLLPFDENCEHDLLINGEEELLTEETFNNAIYPNPTTGIIHIANLDFENYELYNANGVLLKQGTTKNVDLTSFQSGIYLIKVNTSKHQETHKVMKQ